MRKGKLTAMENEFKKVAVSQSKNDIILAKIFSSFWEMYDGLYHTKHAEQIQKLYYTEMKKTLDTICCEVHIEIRTLYGYREKYMQLYRQLRERCGSYAEFSFDRAAEN